MRLNPLHKNDDDVATRDDVGPDGARTDGDSPDDLRPTDDGRRPVTTGVGIEKRRIAPGVPQFGSGLCGYLAAVGSYVVISAIVHAVALRAGRGKNIATALDSAWLNQPTAVKWSGAIALLVLAFVCCLIGGYVCGTMARRSGVAEGFSVWLWAAVAAVVASLIVELSSSAYAALYRVDLFPRVDVGSFSGRNGAILTAIILAAAGLLGALIGAGIGATAHRRVRVADTAV